MMPPRTAKSPGSTTVPVREKPFSPRKVMSASVSTLRPGLAENTALAMTSRVGTRWSAALTVVSRMSGDGRCEARPARVASLPATISATGETRS